MGRVKLNMDLIRNEKSRYTTFRTRKKGLMKKTYELATLCGIDACIIVFGPKFGCRPIEIETWPPSRGEVRRIIKMYRARAVGGKRIFDVSHFFPDQKVESQIDRAHGDNAAANYITDDALNQLSQDQIRELLVSLDGKLEGVKARIDQFKKESQQNMGGTSQIVNVTNQQQPAYVEPLDVHSTVQYAPDQVHQMLPVEQNPSSYVEPLDVHSPVQYAPDQVHQMLPVEQNPMMGPSMMMTRMNDSDYTQFGNAASSSMLYTPYAAPLYHDPTTVMQENMMFNNTMRVPYYTPTFMHYPMVSTIGIPPMQPMLPYNDFSGSQMNGMEANH